MLLFIVPLKVLMVLNSCSTGFAQSNLFSSMQQIIVRGPTEQASQYPDRN